MIRAVLLVVMALLHTNTCARVAIVGGGYGGLACAVKYASLGLTVHVFDSASAPGIGGASAASAGLMHPLAPKGNLIWSGVEGFTSTKAMMDDIREKLDRKVYTHDKLLIRPLYSDKDFKSFSKAAVRHPEWIKLMDDLQSYSSASGVTHNTATVATDEEDIAPSPGQDYKGEAYTLPLSHYSFQFLTTHDYF